MSSGKRVCVWLLSLFTFLECRGRPVSRVFSIHNVFCSGPRETAILIGEQRGACAAPDCGVQTIQRAPVWPTAGPFLEQAPLLTFGLVDR